MLVQASRLRLSHRPTLLERPSQFGTTVAELMTLGLIPESIRFTHFEPFFAKSLRVNEFGGDFRSPLALAPALRYTLNIPGQTPVTLKHRPWVT